MRPSIPTWRSRRELWDSTNRGYGVAAALANIVQASCGETSMMARCTGKTQLHTLEPEDMRALTLATAEATDILLVGKH